MLLLVTEAKKTCSPIFIVTIAAFELLGSLTCGQRKYTKL